MRGVFLQVRLRLGTRPSAVPVAGWDAVPPRDASHNAHADRRSCTSHATHSGNPIRREVLVMRVSSLQLPERGMALRVDRDAVAVRARARPSLSEPKPDK